MGRVLGVALALGMTWLATAPTAGAQEIPQQIRGNCCSCNSQIKFRKNLDLLRLGARLIPTPAAVIDPLLSGMAVELSNANGTLASIVIPPGGFTEKPSGRKWVYKDPSAKTSGGAFVVTLQQRNDQLLKIFKILFRQPSALPEFAQILPDWPTCILHWGVFLGLCWPFLAQNSIKNDINMLIQQMSAFLSICYGLLGQHEAPNPPQIHPKIS